MAQLAARLARLEQRRTAGGDEPLVLSVICGGVPSVPTEWLDTLAAGLRGAGHRGIAAAHWHPGATPETVLADILAGGCRDPRCDIN